MPNYTQQQLLERYRKLPGDLKEAIFSVETAEIIQKISKKYGLHIDKMGELASETGLVMLGITHPRDFISNISSRLEISREKATEIAKDINNEIFSKVRENLKNIHGIKEEKKPETSLPSKPPYPSKPPTPPLSGQSFKAPPNLPVEEKTGNIKKEIPKKEFKKEQIEEIKKETVVEKNKEIAAKMKLPAEKFKKEKKENFPVIKEKIRQEISKKPSQITEIKIPLEETESNFPTGYKSDPYREPIE
jgi:hypothetical protein